MTHPMNDIQQLSKKDQRKWLINEMKEKWYLDEDDIIDGDCADDACVEGNSNINFIDVFNLCEQFEWKGIKFGRSEIEVDILEPRTRKISGKAWHKSPDEFSICDGIMRIWFD